MSNKSELLGEVVKSVYALKSAWLRCNEVFDQYNQYGDCNNYKEDINDIIAKEYPFESSFDEYNMAVIEWANSVNDLAAKKDCEEKIVYETNYSSAYDRTFVMKVNYVGEDIVREECVGFYSGEPDDENTEYYKNGKLVAEYKL